MAEYLGPKENLGHANRHEQTGQQSFDGIVGDTTMSPSSTSALDGHVQTTSFTGHAGSAAIGGGPVERPEEPSAGHSPGETDEPSHGGTAHETPPPIPPIEGGGIGFSESGDDGETARTLDQLFEVLAGERITRSEQRRRGEAYVSSAGHAWLGDSRTPPRLERGYNVSGVVPSNRAVTPMVASVITEHQLRTFSNTFNETTDGIAASDVLERFVRQDASRGIIDRSIAPVPAGHQPPYQTGQYIIHTAENGRVQIIDQGISGPLDAPLLLRYDRPDAGETRLIHPNSRERYIIGGGSIAHETLRNLDITTADYFHHLGIQLTRHQGLLARTAEACGVDINDYINSETGQVETSGNAAQELDARIEEAEPTMDPALRFVLALSAGTIFHAIRERSLTDSTSGILKRFGLRAAKDNVNNYYNALLQAPLE